MSVSIDDAAQQLEAYFVRSFLKEAKIGKGLAGKGFSGDTFADMLQDALATNISDGQGLGIANSLVSQLGPDASQPAWQGALQGKISSDFGHRHDPISGEHKHHAGVDVAAPLGTPVSATLAGTVKFAGERGDYGNVVVIDHGGGIETRYAHLREVSVKPGQRVSKGHSVGSVGETGRSTGPHLHFELRRRGRAINPSVALRALNQSTNGPNF